MIAIYSAVPKPKARVPLNGVGAMDTTTAFQTFAIGLGVMFLWHAIKKGRK